MFVLQIGLQAKEIEFFSNKLENSTQVLLTTDNPLEALEYAHQVEVLTVFIHSQITSEVLDKFPNLKLIITRSTGFDHIDTVAAKAKNILVCNVPAYGSNTVAEHTFALLLALSKRIPELVTRTREQNFHFKDYLGFDLSGKTLGVIGAGKIGRNVIQIARGFDMQVLAHDVYQDDFLAEVLKFEYTDLDNLLQNSDIISLHTPVNDYTCGLLTKNNLLKIKPGAVFINTSRGCLIKNEDLLFALENGIISVAGLDTIDGEEEMFVGKVNAVQEKLLQNPNVIYTPHSAFYTKEALERILEKTVEIVEKFESNQEIAEKV